MSLYLLYIHMQMYVYAFKMIIDFTQKTNTAYATHYFTFLNYTLNGEIFSSFYEFRPKIVDQI